MKVLLDTNVISEISRPQGSAGVKKYAAGLIESQTFLSVISIGELTRGIALLPDGDRRKSLEDWLSEIESHYSDRIFICTIGTVHRWGKLTARVQRAGRTIGAADGLIAATALQHELVLATRSARHFEGIVPEVVEPWSA